MSTSALHTVYYMEITELRGSFFFIKIKSGSDECTIAFNPELKELKYLDNNSLTNNLITNNYQLRKILNKGMQAKV